MSPQRSNTTAPNRHKITLLAMLKTYLLRHLQTFFYSLGQLSDKPFSTFMTTAVIGIALSLPAGLNVLLNNFQNILKTWGDASQISLFLHDNINDNQALQLRQNLVNHPQIADALFISKEEALKEFKSLSGFGNALDALHNNPLPAVIVITPVVQDRTPQTVAQLREELSTRKEVELAQIDMEWVERLHAMMAIGERTVWVLASLLSLAVLLVIGNTVRLAIQNRRDEIIITKLIGATDAFIQRPFLYTGFWYGVIGGFIAIVLIEISLVLIDTPFSRLTALYNSQFLLTGMSINTMLSLIFIGSVLGLIGSWIAVGQHLKDIEPT